MTDLFTAFMVQTDPIIAQLRRPPQPKGGHLDREVLKMLVGRSGNLTEEIIDEEDSDEEDLDEEGSDIDDPDE